MLPELYLKKGRSSQKMTVRRIIIDISDKCMLESGCRRIVNIAKANDNISSSDAKKWRGYRWIVSGNKPRI